MPSKDVDVENSKQKTLQKLGGKDPNEMVTFYFRMMAFDDKSKGYLPITYRKYPNREIMNYLWHDGGRYKAPRNVVEYLSGRYVTAPSNEAEDGDHKKVYRFELDVL